MKSESTSQKKSSDFGAAVGFQTLEYLSRAGKCLSAHPCYGTQISSLYYMLLESLCDCYAISADPDQTVRVHMILIYADHERPYVGCNNAHLLKFGSFLP